MHLSIAGYVIQIIFLPTEWEEKKITLIDSINKYYKGFIVKKSHKIDAKIFFNELSGIPFIDNDTKKYSAYFENKRNNVYETYYHISIYELSQLLLIVIMKLLGSKGFLLHASGVETKKGVVLFIGQSGAGKSTTMKMISNRLIPYSDDCVIVKQQKGRFVAYQAPWIEKDIDSIRKYSKYKNIRLLCMLHKKRNFAIKKITYVELLQELIQNTWTINGVSKNNIKSVSTLTKSGVNGIHLNLNLNDRGKLLLLLNTL